MSNTLDSQPFLYPLTSAQQEIWFDQLLQPKKALYNIGGYLSFETSIELSRFEQAINQVVARHQALRTHLQYDDSLNSVLQYFIDKLNYQLPYLDFSNSENPEQAAQDWMRTEFEKPFTLFKQPLFFFTLCKVSETQYYWFKKYHHLIVDGWSIALIAQDVLKAYQDLEGFKLNNSNNTKLLYSDFIANDLSYQKSKKFQQAQKYWQSVFPVIPKPLFKPRYKLNLSQTESSRLTRLILEKDLHQQLNTLATDQQTSVFHLLLATLSVYFSRTQQHEELVFGLPVLNRANALLKKMVGLFVGISPACFQVDENQSLIELLQQIKKKLQQNYRFQRYPISQINRIVGLNQQQRKQLFDIEVSYEKNAYPLKLQNTDIEVISLRNPHSSLPLSIFIREFQTEKDVCIDLDYNLQFFNEQDIERFKQRFLCLLREIIKQPEQIISQINFIPFNELKQLEGFSKSDNSLKPVYSNIVELFEAQIEKTPDHLAIVFGEQSLTYKELNQRANQLAHHLISLGVKAETLVAIALERSIEMLIALLGVLKAGGAYLPLDIKQPKARLEYILNDSQVQFVICNKNWKREFFKFSSTTKVVASNDYLLAQQPITNSKLDIKPQQLAYIIYTSGSTGQPKGVLIEHRSLNNYVHAIKSEFKENAQFASVSTLAADLGNTMIFGAFATGGCLHILNEEMLLSATQFASYLQNKLIDYLKIVPSHLISLQREIELKQLLPRELLILGGEAAPLEWVKHLLSVCDKTRVLNHYGPTEATIGVSTYEISKTRSHAPRGNAYQDALHQELSYNSLPIGRPLASTELYILNKHLQPQPIGVAGELHIAGLGLARGYLNQPELTQEKFINTKFGRLYKTGDLARWLPDGNLEYIGRIDNQIKLRGFRIELGEIEAQLLTLENIEQAAVIVKEHQNDKQLIAYIVLQKSDSFSKPIRSELEKILPDYMLPSVIIELESLPLNANGKVDRKKLEALEVDTQSIAKNNFIAPKNETEQLLADLFAQILNLKQVSREANFFELGGHSLLATQLISHIRSSFKIELSFKSIFEYPTVAELATQLEKHQNYPTLPEIKALTTSQKIPLSYAQQRLWFLAQLDRGNTYNMLAVFKLKGNLDKQALETSLQTIIERHQSLRYCFPIAKGEAYINIKPKLAPLSIFHVSTQTEIDKLLNTENNFVFNLAEDDLFRISLIQTYSNEHLLLINQHHIISDGWSIVIFMRELETLYSGSKLPPLSIQYSDYAIWQRNWLQAEVLETQINYWKKQLNACPTLLELPTDYPRPAIQQHQGEFFKFSLSAKLTQQLNQLSGQQGVTLYMTLLAAFALLLSRYANQKDIVIGSPIANRRHPQTEDLIGFFVNTLAMRLQLNLEHSFIKLLQQSRETALGAYSHQDLPFEKLIEVLQPERSLSHTPLFQVMFTLQNARAKEFKLGDLEVELLDLPHRVAKFDLTLTLHESENQLTGGFEYRSDLFKPESIERMVQHFEVLLENIVENPKQPIFALSLLSEEEQQQIKFFSRSHAQCGSSDYTASSRSHAARGNEIVLLFEKQVKKTPNNVAISIEKQSLTYEQLNQQANQLAHYLISLDVKLETFIAVSLERSLEVIITILGILKAGAAYIPLDTNLPKARFEFILNDCKADFLISNKPQITKLSKSNKLNTKELIFDDKFKTLLTQYPQTNLQQDIKPENCAYIIYTSGSTGFPKGVVVEHHALAKHCVNMAQYYELQAEDKVLQFASLSFDASIEQIFPTLLTGATLVLLPSNLLTPEQMWQVLTTKQVTVANFPPVYWQQFLTVSSETKIAAPKLRLVVLGGDVLTTETVKQTFNCLPNLPRLINAYGPTEAVITATAQELIPASLTEYSNTIPIGKPLKDREVYILDEHLQTQAISIAGELYIGGEILAQGYLNQPELTKEKFIQYQNKSVYKTGDLARWLPNGEIEYLARVDTQVKLRGFRIELGEIEAQILKLKEIKQAVVIAQETKNDKRLIAYIVSEKTNKPDFRAELKKVLPEYAIPSAFIELESLPVTSSGKVDRKYLEQLETYQPIIAKTLIPAKNETEELLSLLWCQLLELKHISTDTNFFELGGHSLLATQLISRIHEYFNVELPLKSIFESPTIAGLSLRIKTQQQSTLPSIKRQKNTQNLPLSYAQQRIWFLAQLEGASSVYNIPVALKLTGKLDTTRLINSLETIIEGHDSLRMHFSSINGKPQASCSHTLRVNIVKDVLRCVSQEQLKELILENEQHLFDLEKEALFRFQLVQTTPQEHYLLLNLHHIIADGWSLNILCRELSELYNGESYSRRLELTRNELSEIQYQDYAAWQQQWLQGENLKHQQDYWLKQLNNSPTLLELPTDYPRPKEQSYAGDFIELNIPQELSDKFKHFCTQHGSTLYMGLLAVFGLLLSRYSGQQDIVIGSPIANRTQAQTENIIGLFVNTLAMRLQLEKVDNFNELLQQSRQVALDAYAHQSIPFEAVVEALQPERSLSHTPLFQVMLVLQNMPTAKLELNNLKVEVLKSQTRTAKFDLTLELQETSEGLTGGFEYCTALFKAETVKRIAAHFVVLLEAVINIPDQALLKLPLLTATEQEQLKLWNNTAKSYPKLSVVDLFEHQTQKTPDKTAVIFKQQSLSYQQLNQRSNQLAHYLQQQHIKTSDFVIIAVERSIEMLIIVLAVLKTGAAYIPIDINIPEQRLKSILEDSKAKLVLSQSSWTTSLNLPSCLYIDLLQTQLNNYPTDNLKLKVQPENLAYIIYTSGSTGQPKGVMISHQALSNFTQAAVDFYHIHNKDNVLQFASLSFDASIEEIFPTLSTGATLVLRTEESLESYQQFITLCLNKKISVLDLPTAYWQALIKETDALNILKHLRLVIIGGEAVTNEALEMWFKQHQGKLQLVNSYGPTETTVVATAAYLDSTSTHNIGTPLNNIQVHVLNAELEPQPIGIAGELYIGGTGLAKGYLNAPELTAEKFINAKLDGLNETRLYKTGDLVCWLPNGKLQYLGRIDQQIKLRGFRIELGEIETQLLKLEGIKQAVVVLHQHEGDKKLVAYIVSQKASNASNSIKSELEKTLPTYMLPSAFIELESLPLTTSGKINRKALSLRPLEESITDNKAQTETEALLTQIWCEILKLKQIGIHDNFFDLGGHSLLATQLISRIRNTFNNELSLKTLFEKPTIAELAEVLQRQSKTLLPVITKQHDKTPYLSYSQQRLWFLAQLEGNHSAYNMPAVLLLEGEIDKTALEKSLQSIVKRHDSLRMYFPAVKGQATVKLHRKKFQLKQVDISALKDQQELLQQNIKAEQNYLFDLEKDFLFRATLIKLQQNQYVLLLNQHHIISDGWSVALLTQELNKLYRSAKFPKPSRSSLPKLEIQYQDYAAWQQQCLQGEVLQQQQSYWQQQLQGIPELLELVTDKPRPAKQSYQGSSFKFSISESLSAQIKQLCREQNVTLYMLLLSTYAVALSRYSNQNDIVIGSPIANRTQAETENIIGLFVNTLAMRLQLNKSENFSQLLAQARQTALDAYAHQTMPFEKLVEVLQPERNLSHNPVFQVMLVLQNTPDIKLDLKGLTISSLELENPSSKFDLNLHFLETETELNACLYYNCDLFFPETIQQFCNYFVVLLERIVKNPKASFSELKALTSAEKDLIGFKNLSALKNTSDLTINQLFELQVKQQPNNIAIRTETETWTYRQLHQQIDHIVSYLHKHYSGVSTIALLFKTSALAIASMMAALKLGKTYVCLEPDYPQQRLSYMLEDSNAELLLTSNTLNLLDFKNLEGLVCIEVENIEPQTQTVEFLKVDVLQPAYILYTSGSTGQPKGVIQSQRNMLFYIQQYCEKLNISNSDRLSLLSSYSFDAAIIDIFSALITGATLYPCDVKQLTANEFVQWLETEKITVYHSVPTFYRSWIQQSQKRSRDFSRAQLPIYDTRLKSRFQFLRLLVLGGEVVIDDDIAIFQENITSNCQLVDLYGASEASLITLSQISCSHSSMERHNMHSHAEHGNEETEILLLDEQGNESGVYGEIAIKSQYLALGYQSQPESKKRFTPFYKTGDIGRFLADGSLQVLGRKDFQIKLRGFRIELGEIENQLLKLKEIKQAVVVQVDDKLIAYIVKADGFSKPVRSELRLELGKVLPSYMLPSEFIELESLPLTVTGKIDRKKLSQQQVTIKTDTNAKPENETESLLVTLWCQILGLEKVGIHDNFFATGGHSLLATQLISRIRETFNTNLPLSALFEAPTIKGLAKLLQEQHTESLPPLLPLSQTTSLQLSYAQQRLWFLNQLEQQSRAYNMFFALKLTGELNQQALKNSLQTIFKRHQSLHSYFPEHNGKPSVQLHQQMFKLQLIDLSCNSVLTQKQRLKTLLQQEQNLVFNLAKDVLLRVTLICLDNQQYQLWINLHHIIADGWSMGVFVHELSQFYSYFLNTRSYTGHENEKLSIQYSDYAAWQQQLLQSDYLQQQQVYWLQQLKDSPALLELPTDFPRPKVQTYRGKSLNLEIPTKLTHQLKDFSQQQNVTLYMSLLAVFSVLLSRYSNQEDIVIGSPIAGRTHTQTENLIGLFVNTLAMRLQLNQANNFIELLQQTRRVSLEAYQHQDIPFEKLVEVLQPERNLSHSPIFQVMLVLQNLPLNQLQLQGLSVEPLNTSSSISKFDLSLILHEDNDKLEGRLEYNSDLFKPATIKRMREHFLGLLETLIAEPQQKLNTIDFLTSQEKQQIQRWNQTERDYPLDETLVQLIEVQVKKTPDNIAACFENQKISFKSLNQKANQLARFLKTQNVTIESFVAVSMERSLDMLIALLGILKAGAAYIPLDPHYPKARLSYLLKDCQASLLLTQSHLSLPETSTKVVSIENIALENYSSDNLNIALNAENLAYVIYTSGSTGEPKGAMNTHKGIVNRLLWMQEQYPLNKNDCLIQKTPFSFDVSVWEFFWGLLTGTRLVFAKPEGHKDSHYLASVIQSEHITIIHFVPSMLQAFLTEAQASNCHSLKRVICSGETLSLELQQRFFQTFPDVELHNLYGPTEAAIDVSYWACDKQTHLDCVPIGKPIANTQLYILNQDLQPQPIGVAGELYIAGVGLARGYLNRPELTQEKFIQTENFGKLYKTGDLARWLANGNIEYLERLDQQIKLRGFRIELGEIEAQLLKITGIKETAVIVQEQQNDKRLIAYVILEKTESFLKPVKSELQKVLPDYMIPSNIIELDSFPLNSNGKLDRKKLTQLEIIPQAEEQVFIEAKNETEQLLVNLWSQLLGTEPISTHANFFDLGGHSLLATQLMSRIRQTFNVDLALTVLFEYPTVTELAKQLQQHQVVNIPPIKALDEKQTIPLSFAQQRLWFLAQLEDNSTTYNMFFALKLLGNLDIEKLEQSLQILVERHQSLRMSFPDENGQPFIKIKPAFHFHIQHENLSLSLALRLISLEQQHIFDLAKGDLFRVMLIKITEKEHILLISQHHIISDGWSVNLLMKELSALYSGKTLSKLSIQYGDYAAWQRQYLQGEVLKRQQDYWLQQLQSCPSLLDLPTDYPRPEIQSYRGDWLNLEIPKELTQALKTFCKQHSVTLYMMLLATFSVLLSRYSQQQNIVIGSPIANRTQAQTEDIIGFFANTLAMRLRLDKVKTFIELLQQTRKTALEAYAHQEIPFEKLVEILQPERSLSHAPLFQVMLVLQNAPKSELQLQGLDVEVLETQHRVAKFDLTLTLHETEAGLKGGLEYATDLFKPTTIQRLFGHFISLLEAVVKNPHTEIPSLNLLSHAEIAQLRLWNATQVDYPKQPVIQLFEEQVRKTPEQIALSFENVTLSYQELNQRANQLAHYLQKQKIQTKDLIAIAINRSPELLISLLAVLKTGAAYVPLDLSYPKSRLEYVLQDCQPKLLLTESCLSWDTSFPLVEVDLLKKELQQQATQNLNINICPDSLCYVIYTSGSTGKPKGIAMPHRALSNLINWQLSKEHRALKTLQFSSISFDVSFQEIFSTWLAGAELVLINEEQRKDSFLLAQFLATKKIERLFLPFIALQQLAESTPNELIAQLQLKTVISAGEQLQITPSIKNFFKLLKNCRLHNHYGPSETHVVTAYSLPENIEGWSALPPIGSAIANTEVLVLNEALQIQPIGITGEIYIAGDCLADGYVNQPELTAERFIEVSSSRFYRTGDLARGLEDGSIEFLGRCDSQVKLRGFRIELSEIEAVLLQQEQIAKAVVCVQRSENDKKLIAYLVTRKPNSSLRTLKFALEKSLPEYMIPSVFIKLESLPLTPTGKVDRKALAEMEVVSETKPSKHYVAPRSSTELQLLQLWEKLLNVKFITINDNFFDLGGYSLLAVKLLNQIQQQFKQRLPLTALFQAPTIKQLGEFIDAKQVAKEDSNLIPIQTQGNRPALFCLAGAGGNVLYFHALAKHLGLNQPCYGLQAASIHNDKTIPESVEALATEHLKAIQASNLKPPFYLAGHSFGGRVTFELAHQLEQQGFEVTGLFIFDTFAPEGELNTEYEHWQAVDWAFSFMQVVESFLDISFHITLEDLQVLNESQYLQRIAEAFKSVDFLSASADIRELKRLIAIYKANLLSHVRYQTNAIINAPIILFKTQDVSEEVAKKREQKPKDWGWSKYTQSNVTIYSASGNHSNMLNEPHTQSLAQKILAHKKEF